MYHTLYYLLGDIEVFIIRKARLIGPKILYIYAVAKLMSWYRTEQVLIAEDLMKTTKSL